MSGDPFENELSRLFLQPSGEADVARLRLQTLERLEREDRRRGAVITAAAGLGAAIAAGAVAASRLEERLAGLFATHALPAPSLDSLPPAWIAVAVGLALLVPLAGRALRDV